MKTSQQKILDHIYEAVGNTPMVRLQRVPKDEGIECEIVAKCEFMNPAGSTKDRVALEMVTEAEKKGIIKPGDNLIEATSGNTGIGLGFMAACKGYNMLITIPEKNVGNKTTVLKALGVTVIATRSDAQNFEEDSSFKMLEKLKKELPNTHYLNQYSNSSNPGAHYRTTGQEIFDQCSGRVDYVFIGVGTGGTISGVAKKLKELDPHIKVVGIDPLGSMVAEPQELNCVEKDYYVEGIGYDFTPENVDKSVVDSWVKTDDPESLRLARDLIRKEGLFCGASSGSVMEGAIKYLKQSGLAKQKNLRCVVLLADSIRNYLSKFCADEWMVTKGFMGASCLNQKYHPLYGKKVSDLGLRPIVHEDTNLTIKDCMDAFSKGTAAVPYIKNGNVKGFVTKQAVLNGLMRKQIKNSDKASKVVSDDVALVPYDTDLSALDSLLKNADIVFAQKLNNKNRVQELYAVTKMDLMSYLEKESQC